MAVITRPGEGARALTPRPRLFCPFCGRALHKMEIEGRLRLHCLDCDLPIYENPLPATAAVVTDSRGQVLLVKRNMPPAVGRWCLPGGFLENDETPEAGCLRELQEETGLSGRIERLLGCLHTKSQLYDAVLVIGYRASATGGTLRAGDDAAKAAFFPLDALPDIAFPSHRHFIDQACRPVLKPGCFGAYVVTSGNHAALAAAACASGARVVQYREKSADRRILLATARQIRDITAAAGTLFIVNDHVDIALLSEADGVHIGQDDLPLAAMRAICPSRFIIGLSTESPAQALAAQEAGADYIGIGPVFATPVKGELAPIGLEVLKTVLEQVVIPVVAIGGITLQNLPQLKALGLRDAAMVREFQTDTAHVVQQVNTLLAGL